MQQIQKVLTAVVVAIALFAQTGTALAKEVKPEVLQGYSIKSYWPTAMNCIKIKIPLMPEKTYFTTGLLELLDGATIEKCLIGMANEPTAIIHPSLLPPADIVKRNDTKYMQCHLIFFNGEFLHRVSFANWHMSGKQKELEQCVAGMTEVQSNRP
jgi:hypothetical protein